MLRTLTLCFAVELGGGALDLFKGDVEGIDVEVTYLLGDLGDLLVGVGEKPCRLRHTQTKQIVSVAYARELLEAGGKIIL